MKENLEDELNDGFEPESGEEAYKDRADIVIENDIAIWNFRTEGLINGTYAGTFKFRCFLTPSKKIAAGREYRDLLGPHGIQADKYEAFLAYALTQLRYRIISAPPFWNPSIQDGSIAGDIPDEEVLTAILDAAVGAELKYRHMLKKRKEDAIQKAKVAAERILDNKAAEKEEKE